jgi:hypothetical protein
LRECDERGENCGEDNTGRNITCFNAPRWLCKKSWRMF